MIHYIIREGTPCDCYVVDAPVPDVFRAGSGQMVTQRAVTYTKDDIVREYPEGYIFKFPAMKFEHHKNKYYVHWLAVERRYVLEWDEEKWGRLVGPLEGK